MAEGTEIIPARLPDHNSVEATLSSLPSGTDTVVLADALSRDFPGFVFSAVDIGQQYSREPRSVVAADGTRIAEYRPWIGSELTREGGNVGALWNRLQASGLQISQWHGDTCYAFASTGRGAADYVQVELARELEWLVGPIFDRSRQPWSQGEIFDPPWIEYQRGSAATAIAGPHYRLLKHSGSSVVHMRTFLGRCARLEREKREARRADMERRVWVKPDGIRTSFLDASPDWFNLPPREVRFFQDWEQSSAAAARVYDHWALDIKDYEESGEREIGFIPRPLRLPAKRLGAGEFSVHGLMDRVEMIDREAGLSFAWFFLMVHGNKVDADVGHAIAQGLRDHRIVLPEQDARVLFRWAEHPYGF
ncbi:hypothetical protein G6M78_15710 [Agrobacterium tumefaciens]|uniref:hypothetical protein n=1 Tax=Agrobacterium tumefaciens TaxID=358 RepID=UPI0015731F4A|nr:hypothetical protein [Agrobacterium tumefaciens]MCZ7497309.1 hypothetical protein [Rhizobium rhizogenes]NTE56523.1 hypothetical protein [Agrobacterium tumefaciens]NTE74491.1 hypothetical protein [Agrobacterium tumefaciens]